MNRFGTLVIPSSRAIVLLLLSLPLLHPLAAQADYPKVTLQSLEGTPVPLSTYAGKVILATNTASLCGYTPQYKDLEAVYQKYKSKGLVVLGFPSNDFGSQEPGSNKEIKKFCKTRFNISFPMFEKGPVAGEKIQPLFTLLTKEGPEELRGPIQWNFEKFLLDKKGSVRARFGSYVNPMNKRIRKKVEELLAEKK